MTREFWAHPEDELLRTLGTTAGGLTAEEAERRYRPPRAARGDASWRLLLRQFGSPIVLILIAAAGVSIAAGDRPDAFIVLAIVGVSALLGFWQERGATDAVRRLLNLVRVEATVLRDGRPTGVPREGVVPGDVLLLSAGSALPGDVRLLEARDLHADEAVLTGETFPVEKAPGTLPPDTPLARRANALFAGTHVVSGQARAVVVHTGAATELGRLSERLKQRPPETEFERGIKHFGLLLMEVTLFLVASIFAVNVAYHRPVLESFLFALALAIGLTPQLLPAIISVNLAHGARRMAAQKVVVKRLAAIENFGSMDLLCSDKTGTLTEGRVTLHAALDPRGGASDAVLDLAALNAAFETGFANPIDAAIREARPIDAGRWRKLDEVPWDFVRKRLSVLVQGDGAPLMVTKGALAHLLEVCSTAAIDDGLVPLDEARAAIDALAEGYARDGLRVLGVARKAPGKATIGSADEADLTFAGFLLFTDPPKPGIEATIERLHALGIGLKIITGDNRLVAESLGRRVGLAAPRVLAGDALGVISDPALTHVAERTDIFAEVEPNQKERIILALRRAGHVVGYMGDGINDAPALHAADVSLSVDDAADVAKEAADIVLLEKDLNVLVEGVRAGRVTFANTLKYVFMATSANFGNMFSMAGASLFLPYLPLLPKQILFINLLTDLPEMTIAADRVDPELIERPRRWDIRFIRRFMLVFGTLSSVFDYLTFAVLLWGLHAGPRELRTGWLVESVVSASLIVLVIRTRRPALRSRPGHALAVATGAVVAFAVALPFTPLAAPFDLQPLPASFGAALAAIVCLYFVAAELAKRWFYRAARR
jgi:Mg2+-importing ATPase